MDIEDIKRESVKQSLREFGRIIADYRFEAVTDKQKEFIEEESASQSQNIPTIEYLWANDVCGFFDQFYELFNVSPEDVIPFDSTYFPGPVTKQQVWEILDKYIPECSDQEDLILEGRDLFAKEHNLPV